MAKPFDIATRHLVESQPNDWIAFLQLEGTFNRWVEADLTAVSAEADKVLEIWADRPYLTHIEFQSSYDPDMDWRVFHYNTLLAYRHRLPVQSVLILLRPESDGSAIEGTIAYQTPGEGGRLAFHYRVVRIWTKPVEEVLSGGTATLPFVPLAAGSAEALPEVIRRMEARFRQELADREAAELWTATYLLMGLRYPPDLVQQLLQGVINMKESSTYQVILEEGKAEGTIEGRSTEARSLILRIGSKRYGEADERVKSQIDSIESLEVLEQLADRLLEVETWEELLKDLQ